MGNHDWPQEEEHNRWRTSTSKVGQRTSSSFEARPLSSMRQATNHQRTMTESVQRPLQPSVRLRSHTANGLNTLGRPLLSLDTEVRNYESRPQSVNYHGRTESSSSLKRTLKSKASRLLRRQTSHGNLTSLQPIDWSEELDDSPWEKSSPSLSAKRQTRKNHRLSQFQEEPEETPIRYTISQPFDFRHLTHTNDNDFREMQNIPARKLGPEFSTLRAWHAPRGELRGIRAETISRHDQYAETSPPNSSSSSRPTTPRRPSGGVTPQVPARPEFPWGAEEPSGTQVPERSPLDETSSSPSLPPFTGNLLSPSVEKQPQSTVPDLITPPDSPSHDDTNSSANHLSIDFTLPHAVTTPDDAAHVLRPPPFEMVRTELSRVIEEDEVSDRRSSLATLSRRPSTADSSLRHVKSFPASTQALDQSHKPKAEAYRQSVQTSPKKQRRSYKVLTPSFDDVDGDVPYQRRMSRYSATVKDVEGNWGDVIDWCYDHEAEADCNFDFTRAVSPPPHSPTEEPLSEPTPLLHSKPFALEKSERRSSSVYSASPPLLPQLRTSTIPDLDPPSAISAQSSFDGTEAATPDSVTPVSNLDPRFPLFSSKPNFSKPNIHHTPHVSNDTTSPDFYESLCQDAFARDSWTYGRGEGSTISSISARSSSSRSPISKSSSLESFSLRRHRSNNNSQGSLPELIPSRFSREKDHLQETNVDHLSALSLDDPRRKSPTSLVKDVAQKNLISKLQNGTLIEDACSAQVPLPLHPAFRGTSDDPNQTGPSDRHSSFQPPLTPTTPTTLLDRKTSHRATLAPSFLSRNDSLGALPRPSLGNRNRSASDVKAVKASVAPMKSVNISPRASRASYGLYPVNGRR